jgi:hypothetical protein
MLADCACLVGWLFLPTHIRTAQFIGYTQHHVNIARLRKQSLIMFVLLSPSGPVLRKRSPGLCWLPCINLKNQCSALEYV